MAPYVWLALGMIMIFIEFFIPGAVMGIGGTIFVIMSLILFAQSGASPLALLAFTAFVLAILYFVFRFALWRIRASKKEQTFYQDTDQEGFYADKYDENAVHKKGIALTDLRPAGRILVDGKIYQAISQGPYIEKESEIYVIGGEGPTLIVQKLTSSNEKTHA